MDFQADNNPSDRKRQKLKPPPNYLSRPVQYRLMLLIGMTMAILALMFEARKPENWYWMGFERPVPTAPPQQALVDIGQDILPTYQIVQLRSFPAQRDTEGESAEDPLHDALNRARADGWSETLAALQKQDRLNRDRLSRALKAARDDQLLDDQQKEAWSQTLAQLKTAWKQYLLEAHATLEDNNSELNREEKQLWIEVLRRLQAEWSVQIEPALRALIDSQSLTSDQKNQLARLQTVLDHFAIQQVRDDVFPVFRSREKDAWFRMLEILDRADLPSLQRASTRQIGYLQLYNQPETYRGRLVTFRGMAHWGYQETAPKNVYGISSYTIFWVQPTDGPTATMVVYALQTPPGFPEIEPKQPDGGMTEIKQEVEFVGYLFKRWAYRTADGARTAPVILAKEPIWRQQAPLASNAIEKEPPGIGIIWLIVVSVAAGSAGIALLVYRNNRRSPMVARMETILGSQTIKSFDDSNLLPSVGDSLHQLSQSDSGDQT